MSIEISRNSKDYPDPVLKNETPVLKDEDIIRIGEISNKIFLIDRNLSKLTNEKTDVQLMASYIQKNYPELSELQEESMNIIAKINHPFSVSISESPFFSCDFLGDRKFTVDEKTKKEMVKLSEKADTNRTNLTFLIKPLLVVNLKLFLLQGQHKKVQDVFELSSQILGNINEITGLSLVVKMSFVRDILSTYKSSRTLLPCEHAALCDSYEEELLHSVLDAIFKYAVVLKYNINTMVSFCRVISSGDRVVQLLVIEQFVDNLIASIHDSSMLNANYEEYNLYGKNLVIDDVFVSSPFSEVHLLVMSMKVYREMNLCTITSKTKNEGSNVQLGEKTSEDFKEDREEKEK